MNRKQYSSAGIICIMIVLFMAYFSSSFAAKPKVEYFLQISGTAVLSDGDLDGVTTISGEDADSNVEEAYVPLVDNQLRSKFFVGAHVNASNVIFSLGYMPLKTEWTNTSDSISQVEEGDATWFLMGFEYRYNFLWPDPFRVYMGLGYDFERLSLKENSTDSGGNAQGTIITGRGFHGSAGVIWMFHEHFGLDAGTTFGYVAYENFSTDNSGYAELDDNLVQAEFELLVGFRVLF